MTKAQLAQMEKEEEGLRLREQILSIIAIHRVTFPPVEKPVVARPPAPELSALQRSREKELLAGISFFKRAERGRAKAKALELAKEDVREKEEEIERDHATEVERVDEEWARLLANDPDIVISVVDQAFEDNDAPAAPVDVEGSTLSLVVLVPPIEEVPERKPSVTPSGKPTVKKMTKQERGDLYLTLVCGHLLATIKEALAVAPSIADVKGVVVRRGQDDVFGNERMEVLLAARYSRDQLARVKWDDVLPSDVVQEAASELTWNLKGRPPQLQSLDLDSEPHLKEFVDALSRGTNLAV